MPGAAQPAGEEEQPRITQFLGAVFHAAPGAPLLDPRLFRWKYFDPRPDWSSARSWVVREGDALAAHVGVWPLGFETATGTVNSLHLIDWAADPRFPGSGILLYREMMKRAPVVLAVGGSEAARKLLGKIGFTETGELTFYARVTRSWKQFRMRAGSWKHAAKLLRNTAWKAAAHRAPRSGWEAQPVRVFPDSLAPVLPRGGSASFTPSSRSVELLNYLLVCPTASCRAFVLSSAGRPMGYFLLSRLGPQARIADLWVASAESGDWAAAFSLAADAAAADPLVCEVSAAASTEFAARALREAAFRAISAKPLWLHDPQSRLRNLPPIHIQQVESDGFFLHDPNSPFLT